MSLKRTASLVGPGGPEFIDQGFGGGTRVRGVADRAADDHVVGSCLSSVVGRGGPGLVPLVGAGRAPNVEQLGLGAAGVRFDSHRGVEVDQRLRTTNPRIFAAGDVCSKFKFTHAADAMARIVIRNALLPGSSKVTGLLIPWCLLSLYLADSRPLLAGAALAASTMIRPLMLICLPVLLVRRPWKEASRTAVGFAGLIVLLVAPYAAAGTRLFESLWVYARHWRFNGSLFLLLEALFGKRRLVRFSAYGSIAALSGGTRAWGKATSLKANSG